MYFYHMENFIDLVLPRGFRNIFGDDDDNGLLIKNITMRQINGYDEEYIHHMHDKYPAPLKTTLLLSRIVRFQDKIKRNAHESKAGNEMDSLAMMRHLAIGDRIYLMLNMRLQLFGDNISGTIGCPMCDELISLDLSVFRLLQPTRHQMLREEFATFDIKNVNVKVRPITGKDQEDLVNSFYGSQNDDEYDDNVVVVGDENDFMLEAKRKLIKACIVSCNPPLSQKIVNDMPEDFLSALSSKLDEFDPLANISLNLSCPKCNSNFKNQFDVESYVFEELQTRYKQMEEEVHWIAFNYHWAEDSILSLPLSKRKRYIELINKTLGMGE